MSAMRALGRVTGWTCVAISGVGRLATRATVGRPHRFHDLLLGIELAAPVVVEALGRRERAAR